MQMVIIPGGGTAFPHKSIWWRLKYAAYPFALTVSKETYPNLYQNQPQYQNKLHFKSEIRQI